MTPEELAQSKNFNTPPPPEDPASVRGSRKDPLYIGPTSFGNLQKQFTPYQIEQGVRRDAATGDVFYKEGVDINSIPKTAPGPTGNAIMKSTDVPMTPTTSDLTVGDKASGLTMTREDNDAMFRQSQAAAANKALNGTTLAVDSLAAKRQELQAEARQLAEDAVKADTEAISSLKSTDLREKALKADRELFQVNETISALNSVRGKIASATSALEQGLIYEESRPVRMQLLTGRSNELYKQGVAGINALNASAELIQGNLTIAQNYMTQTQNAIDADAEDRMNALTTLLDFDEKALIRLSEDEKETVNLRMGLLQGAAEEEKKNVERIYELAVSNPIAFAEGEVSFADDIETALQKMIPRMAHYDRLKLLADLDAKNRSGRGSSGRGGTASPTGDAVEDMYNAALDDLTTGQQTKLVSVEEDLAKEDDPLQWLKDNKNVVIAKTSPDMYAALVARYENPEAAEMTQEEKYTETWSDLMSSADTYEERLDLIYSKRTELVDYLGHDGDFQLIEDVKQQFVDEEGSLEKGFVEASKSNPIKDFVGKGVSLVKKLFGK